jgi:hypothetical protein
MTENAVMNVALLIFELRLFRDDYTKPGPNVRSLSVCLNLHIVTAVSKRPYILILLPRLSST